MKYCYWFASIISISNLNKMKFVLAGYTAKDLFHIPLEELKSVYGITDKVIDHLRQERRKNNLDMEYEKFLETGVEFVCYEQKEYPKKLRNIEDAPYGLFYIGELPDENQYMVGIVGARQRSSYGNQIARQIAKALGENKIGVISGMANGIDTDGHIGCLDANGKTYAVLGSGVDVIYPKQNEYLYHRIIKSGGVISEYPPGTRPITRNFPARNRIISGLSDVIIVIEAKEKSGSLITADFAMEQGREVYALPGRITDSLSQGCNYLIKQGANVFYSIEDFLKDIHIMSDFSGVQMSLCKNLLEKDELLVYSLLDFRPTGIGYIYEETNLEMGEILTIIEGLIQKGFIKEEHPNYYIKIF